MAATSEGANWGVYHFTLPNGQPFDGAIGFLDRPSSSDGDYVDAGAGNDQVMTSNGADRALGGALRSAGAGPVDAAGGLLGGVVGGDCQQLALRGLGSAQSRCAASQFRSGSCSAA